MYGTSQRYVSRELTHFIGRGLSIEKQYNRFVKIIREGWLTHPPHNPNISGNLTVRYNANISSNEMYNPEMVCFCDIPITDLGIHTKKYSTFGLSFTKDFIISKGGSPVYYLPLKTSVHSLRDIPHEEIFEAMREGSQCDVLDLLLQTTGKDAYFDQMVHEYHTLFALFYELVMLNTKTPGVPEEHSRIMKLQQFFDFHIFSYLKFYDHSCPDQHPDNYYMEREWRVLGNIQFTLKDIRTVFLPEEYASHFRKDFPKYSSQVVFLTTYLD